MSADPRRRRRRCGAAPAGRGAPARSRWSSSACIAGSNRLRSRKLQRRGIRQGSRAQMPDGSKRWIIASTRLDSRASSAPSRSATRRKVGRQIAGLVDAVDQMAADQPLRPDRVTASASCSLEMVGERLLARRRRLRVDVVVGRRGAGPDQSLQGGSAAGRRPGAARPQRRRERRCRDRCRDCPQARRGWSRARRRSIPRRAGLGRVRLGAAGSAGPPSSSAPAPAADSARARPRHRRRGRDWTAAAA